MATYTHHNLDMVTDNNAPGPSWPFSAGPVYTMVLAECSSTQLVFTYANQNANKDPGKVYVFGTGFTSFNFAGNVAQADTVTGWARYTSDGGTLLDEITNFYYDGGGSPFSMGPGNEAFFFAGDDTFNGSEGRDVMEGGEGNDLMFGNGGDDHLGGAYGDNELHGGAGNDIVSVGGVVSSGTNLLYGDNGDDQIYGNAGIDSLYGGTGNDMMYGYAGNDVLKGGQGADYMDGSIGDDTYFVENIGDIVVDIEPSGGFDRVYTTVSMTLGKISGVFNGIEVVDAGAATAGVTLIGNDHGQALYGSAWADILTGGFAAINILDGRGGDDVMTGSISNDTFYVDSAGDAVNDGTAGIDTVYASVDFTLAAGQGIDFFFANAGSTGLALTGNEFANTIHGKAGDDTLDGSTGNDLLRGYGGADRLIGGAGLDTLFGGAGNDVFVLQKFAGNRDFIRDFAHGADKLEVSEAAFGELDGFVPFASRFLSNTDGLAVSGGTGDTRFIYNSTDGKLYFDADGTGAGAGRLIAIFTGAPVIDSGDFLVV